MESLRSWAEVNLAAVQQNLAAVRNHIPATTRIMGVVKANAYGHGAARIAEAIVDGVDAFGVANATEAHEVARHAKGKPVYLLGIVLPSERADVIASDFIPPISSLEEAAAYSALASGKKAKIFVSIDTGMGRMGVWQDDAKEEINKITQLPDIEFTGISSHLPVADEDDAFTREQLARFHAIAGEIRDSVAPHALIHIENSAGLIGFPEYIGSMVRPGLMLYGVSPRPEFESRLTPALTWKTRVILVREVEAGRTISYGRAFTTDRSMRIATLAAGYADGYPRQVSGKGAYVLIHGQRCPVLGRITMDQTMVDVTHLPKVSSSDEVVLLGSQGSETISAHTLGQWAGTIAWHILTGITGRVTRVYTGISD